MARALLVPVLACVLLAAGCAGSGGRPLPGREQLLTPISAHRERLALTVENDSILGTDTNYTNGVALTWISRERTTYPEDSLRRRWMELGSLLPFVGNSGYHTFAAVSLGQEMFTPEDASLGSFEAQRPYAGVLFLDSYFVAARRRVTHSWKLRAGLVGPASLAEDAQDIVHRITGDTIRDWSDQLPNEPLANVDYNFSYRLAEGDGTGTSRWRIVPVATLGVGTYFTGAGLGVYGEHGWNLPETIGLISVRRGLSPFTAIGMPARMPWSVSLVAGGGLMVVGHYLPLDGTVFRDSPSVDTKPFVGFGTAGLAVRRGRWSFGMLLTTLSDSFEGQPSRETFGTATLTWSM